ncbi:MAG TPA: site-2 protease family protein [Candidatus Dormibacteraeota bacterium]|nr:site-2 protease family protein [Candidatus Dormibacteraeota bacterium]
MGIPIARIFGIEIRVQITWAFILALVAVIAVGQLTSVDPHLEQVTAWFLGGVVALGFFLSSVSHDLAHALVARRRGIAVRSIAISFFGGASPLDPASPDPGDDAAIAASGPIASIAIGVVLLLLMVGAAGLGQRFDAAAGVLAVLVFLNMVLGFVNLVPAYPLDGGRIVRDLQWRRSGSEQAGWRAASRSGRFTGWFIVGLGLVYLLAAGDLTGAMIALTGWFLVLSSNTVRDRVRLDELVGDHLVGEVMEQTTTTVSPTLTVDTFAAQMLDVESTVSAVPVTNGDAVIGLLGAGQVRRLRRSQWASTHVADVMATPPRLVFLTPTQSLREGLEQVAKARLDGLPVLEDGRLVGVLSRRSIGRFIGEKRARAKAAPTDPVP